MSVPPSCLLQVVDLGKRYGSGPPTLSGIGALVAGRGQAAGDGQGDWDTEGFWALRGLSFEVAAGSSLGVIGRNGAGKSTLLRLLAGTARPTLGSVRVRGKIASLLDLGVGFQSLETGRENAETSLVLQAGYTRREARERAREVQAFAGLGEDFERPIRTYSDGMRLRLAFASLTLLDPDLLVTDEVLVVGDEGFQRKCRRWFEGFLGRGGTLVLCAHDLAQVQELCPRTLWLERGCAAEIGESREVVRHYREAMGSAAAGGQEAGGEDGTRHEIGHRAGLPFEVIDLRLFGADGAPCEEFEAGETLVVQADLLAPSGIPQVHIGITREDLTPVFGVSSDMDDARPTALGGDRYRYRLTFDRPPLTGGRHRLRAHALDETGTRLFDTVERPFSVRGEGVGLVSLDARWHPDREP